MLPGGRSATAGGQEAEREGDSHTRATGRRQSRGGCGATGTGGSACIECRRVAKAGDAGNRPRRECKY